MSRGDSPAPGLSGDVVRYVAEAVAARLGRSSPELIETVVAEVLGALGEGGSLAAGGPAPAPVTTAKVLGSLRASLLERLGLAPSPGAAGLGPAGLGPADLGPADLGPAGLGPAGLGPADLGPADLGAGGVLRDLDHCALCREHESRSQRRAVCTTTGKNRRGIVATVARVIAESGGDILDIAQTLVGDYFTMIIVLDLRGLDQQGLTFSDLRDRLVRESEALGVHTVVMRDDVMNALQRV